MENFLRRYRNLTRTQNARLASSLHRFGWVFRGNVRGVQGGFLRRGRRIPVSAKAAGRRRKFVSRGKAKLLPGRPKGLKGARVAQYPPSQFYLPCRKQAPGKRKHSLQVSIQAGTQNGDSIIIV
jgi:hypothetical protein